MLFNKIAGYFKKQVEPNEWPVLIWSFLYFVFLLTGYFILRPIREEMGVTAGKDNLKWLFATTFIVMMSLQPLYGKLVSRYPRKQFIPMAYGFFALLILIIWGLFQTFGSEHVGIARMFFVFVSVYNLFVVSIFWSFMADVYNKKQGARLFGIIAAGGSTGGIIGSLITSNLVSIMGTVNLLLISAGFLLLCLFAVLKIRVYASEVQHQGEVPLGGSAWEGMQLLVGNRLLQHIALLTVLSVTIGSIYYYLQADFVGRYSAEQDTRTALFGNINMITNILTLVFQLILIPFLMQKIKIHKVLMIYPVLMFFNLMMLGLFPVILVVLGGIALQRSGAYGLLKPPADWLYTGLPDNIKYKFKNFVDTVIYRGGDVFAQFIVVGYLIADKNSLLNFLERTMGFDWNETTVLIITGVLCSLLFIWNAYRLGIMAQQKFAESPNH
jgi:AAA family ATP:ADP antiporter